MTDFFDVKINQDVKKFLQWLNKEYEFRYMFIGEKFGLVNNLNILKKPILILSPENDDEYKGIMRVWAYGGSIAEINITSGEITLAGNIKDYSIYLQDGYCNGQRDFFFQEGLFDDWDKPAEDKFFDLVKSHKKEKQYKIDHELLDLCVFAAYTRYLNRSIYKHFPTHPQEKSVQCVIAKNNILNSVYNLDKESMVVIDVETHLFVKGNKHPRADFVVFDGKSFGLIEFKYLGQSMDKKTNDLEKHYCDFIKAMDKENAKLLFERLKMKLKYLMGYELIDKSWNNISIEMLNKTYDDSVLWCGFCFLGDATDIPGKRKDIVEDRILKQLKPIFQSGKVKCKYQKSRIEPGYIDDIKMCTADISDLWK